jgi:phosphoribosylformylglycinamidine cyclo-ligase
LDPNRWRMPSVMRLLGALGGLDEEEIRATFNGGIGMVVAVRPEAVEPTIGRLAADGIPAAIVGEVVTADQLDGARYAEGRLA